MEAAAHTPGPWAWFLHITDGTWHIGHSRQVYESGQPTIADIGTLGDTETKAANARLIAAAPDMLEALRQIVWKLNHNFDQPGYKGPARITREDTTIHMAVAAIAKATT